MDWELCKGGGGKGFEDVAFAAGNEKAPAPQMHPGRGKRASEGGRYEKNSRTRRAVGGDHGF
jgi:hypothetical protein